MTSPLAAIEPSSDQTEPNCSKSKTHLKTLWSDGADGESESNSVVKPKLVVGSDIVYGQHC